MPAAETASLNQHKTTNDMFKVFRSIQELDIGLELEIGQT